MKLTLKKRLLDALEACHATQDFVIHTHVPALSRQLEQWLASD